VSEFSDFVGGSSPSVETFVLVMSSNVSNGLVPFAFETELVGGLIPIELLFVFDTL